MRRFALLLCLISAPFGGARGAPRIDAGLSLAPVFDSNPRRTTGAPPVADGALLLIGDVQLLSEPFDGARTLIGWETGARIYGSERPQDEWINRLRLQQLLALGSVVGLRAGLGMEDHAVRGGEREFTEWSGDLETEFLPGALLSPRLRGSWRVFEYDPDLRWSFQGAGLSLGLALRPGGRHLLVGSIEEQRLDYGEVRAEGDDGPFRDDRLRSVSLDWSLRGPTIFGAGWQLAENESNARGNGWTRHRLHALLGARLPFGQLLLSARATLQILRFTDGLQIDPEFLHIEQERGENLSSLSLKLSRPLSEHLSMELRYQLHASTFLERVLPYERHLAGAGVSLRL